MKGVGTTRVAKEIVAKTMELETCLQLKSWYGRVPSHSNVSDNPSRGSEEQPIAFAVFVPKSTWERF